MSLLLLLLLAAEPPPPPTSTVRQGPSRDGGTAWGVECINCDSLPGGAATSALQSTGNASLSSLDSKTPALVSGRVPVDGSGATQPVSAAALPLPSGAATSAAQSTGNTSLSSIDGKTPALVSGRVPVDPSGVTSPVSAASLPLPTGASTEATLALIKAKTDNIDVAVSTRTKPADQQHVIIDSAAAVPVTGTFWQATQPVSGTVTANAGSGTMAVSLAVAPTTPVTGTFWQATQPISASSLPLPSGAATDATLSQLLDGGVALRGQLYDGTTRPAAMAPDGIQWVRQAPAPTGVNPLALPCNAVRRINCR